jgi:futalosine hydrolase
VYADEGMESPTGFLDCQAMGFPLGPFDGSAIPADPVLLDVLRPLCEASGPIATVSTCSGTDARAAAVRARTGALAEAMEGAAVAHVAVRMAHLHPGRALATGELRVISNTTGQRDLQVWDIKRSLSRLTDVLDRFRRASSDLQR